MNTLNLSLAFLLVTFSGSALSNPEFTLSAENIQTLVRSFAQLSTVGFPDGFLSAPQLIEKNGYPIEEHDVTTEDGYILTLHRIPYGKDSGPSQNKPVVWLQHGMLCDSSNWIITGEEKGLGYILANLGYDVWLGNARGNTYSRHHVNLSVVDSEYWQFSWNEMGAYDVPAVINYILETTGHEDLYYIGHSMGTTMMFAAFSFNPSLNDKIRLFTALAPATYMEYAESPLMAIAPYMQQITMLLNYIGVYDLLPSSLAMDTFALVACNENSTTQELCANLIFIVAGPDPAQLNATLLPAIIGHMPSGASLKTIAHYAQISQSGIFRQFDYGPRNVIIYGQPDPPAYDITRTTVPVAVYWGQNDWLSSPRDVEHLMSELPNLARNHSVAFEFYNHFDFIYAIDNDVLLNPEVISFMQEY